MRIVDTDPGRVRRPLDLVRLVALLLAGLLLLGIGVVARDTSRGVNSDLARLLSEVPHVFFRGFSLLASFGALAVPLAFMVREIVRGQTRRLIEALLTGLLAIAVVEGLDRLVSRYPTSRTYEALTRVGASGAVRPFDTYLVALLAFVAVTGVATEPLWSGLLVGVTALYVLSVFTATQASLLSLVLSLILGSFVGVAVRYVAGRVSKRPSAEQLVAALAARGIELRSFERAADSDAGRVYLATDMAGQALEAHVLDRELIASGAVSNVYRLIRIRKEIAPAPALSLERVAEHRSLLSMATAVAEVPIPRLLAGVRVGPDAIALVYEHRTGTPLADPSADQLEQLWRIASRLHRNRVTHRGMTATAIRVDPSRRPAAADPEGRHRLRHRPADQPGPGAAADQHRRAGRGGPGGGTAPAGC